MVCKDGCLFSLSTLFQMQIRSKHIHDKDPSLHVDMFFMFINNIMITRISTSTIVIVKDILHDRLSMMDMGPLHYFLGLEISQDASRIKLS